VSDEAASWRPRLLRLSLHPGMNGGHELLPELKTDRGHMCAFSCSDGIYKRVRLCDDLRVKYHRFVLQCGFDVDSTVKVLSVDEAGLTPCFFNARNSHTPGS
jgi:hypothetical protein